MTNYCSPNRDPDDFPDVETPQLFTLSDCSETLVSLGATQTLTNMTITNSNTIGSLIFQPSSLNQNSRPPREECIVIFGVEINKFIYEDLKNIYKLDEKFESIKNRYYRGGDLEDYIEWVIIPPRESSIPPETRHYRLFICHVKDPYRNKRETFYYIVLKSLAFGNGWRVSKMTDAPTERELAEFKKFIYDHDIKTNYGIHLVKRQLLCCNVCKNELSTVCQCYGMRMPHCDNHASTQTLTNMQIYCSECHTEC